MDILPSKLSKTTFEVAVKWERLLRPGQVVRFGASSAEVLPFYGEVISLEEDRLRDCQRATFTILAGHPHMGVRQAEILSNDEILQWLRSMPATTTPLQGDTDEKLLSLWSRLSIPFSGLQGLTTVELRATTGWQLAVNDLLLALSEASRLVVLDAGDLLASLPCLQEMQNTGLSTVVLGEALRFSIQSVGVSPFLEAVAGALPKPLQEEAVELLASIIPSHPDFIPFSGVVVPNRLEPLPAKSPLLHQLFSLRSMGVFAEEPNHVFSAAFLRDVSQPCTLLKFNLFNAYWKQWACEQVLSTLPEAALASSLQPPITWVVTLPRELPSSLEPLHQLLYYLSTQVSGVFLVKHTLEASEGSPDSLLRSSVFPTNKIQVLSGQQVFLQGTFTSGLPVTLSLLENSEFLPQSSQQQTVPHLNPLASPHSPFEQAGNQGSFLAAPALAPLPSPPKNPIAGPPDASQSVLVPSSSTSYFSVDPLTPTLENTEVSLPETETIGFVTQADPTNEPLNADTFSERDISTASTRDNPPSETPNHSLPFLAEEEPPLLDERTGFSRPPYYNEEDLPLYVPPDEVLYPESAMDTPLYEIPSEYTPSWQQPAASPGDLTPKAYEPSIFDESSLSTLGQPSLIASSEESWKTHLSPHYQPPTAADYAPNTGVSAEEYQYGDSVLQEDSSTDPLFLPEETDDFNFDLSLIPEDLIPGQPSVTSEQEASFLDSWPSGSVASADATGSLPTPTQAPAQASNHASSQAPMGEAYLPNVEAFLSSSVSSSVSPPTPASVPVATAITPSAIQFASAQTFLNEGSLPEVHRPPSESEKPLEFHEGDTIRHEKYGVGIVQKIIPLEGRMVLNILFEAVGKRLLDPTLSKLEKL